MIRVRESCRARGHDHPGPHTGSDIAGPILAPPQPTPTDSARRWLMSVLAATLAYVVADSYINLDRHQHLLIADAGQRHKEWITLCSIRVQRPGRVLAFTLLSCQVAGAKPTSP